MMRITGSLHAVVLTITLAASLGATNFAHAQIAETISRDQKASAAPTMPSQQARGPSVIASDASTRAPAAQTDRWLDGVEVPRNGAGIPVDRRKGTELPGFTLGGTY